MHHPNFGCFKPVQRKTKKIHQQNPLSTLGLARYPFVLKHSRHLFLSPLFTFDANSAPHRTIFLPFPMVTSLRCSALPGGFMVVSTGPR